MRLRSRLARDHIPFCLRNGLTRNLSESEHWTRMILVRRESWGCHPVWPPIRLNSIHRLTELRAVTRVQTPRRARSFSGR